MPASDATSAGNTDRMTMKVSILTTAISAIDPWNNSQHRNSSLTPLLFDRRSRHVTQ
jgi:hypothetical protein